MNVKINIIFYWCFVMIMKMVLNMDILNGCDQTVYKNGKEENFKMQNNVYTKFISIC